MAIDVPRERDRERDFEDKSLGPRHLLQIGLLGLTFVPFAIVVFGGVYHDSPLVVAVVTGAAIVSAAMYLSWATEMLEGLIPIGAALAILALIEVLPEYSFEVVLAWQQKIELAASSMTGSNRLLLGLGWPLIFFTAYFSARRRRVDFREIAIPRALAIDIAFLSAATVYALIIVAKGTLAVYDGVLLAGMYVAYIATAFRFGHGEADDDDDDDDEPGLVGRLKALQGRRRVLVILAFLAFGAVVIFFGAEPFISGLIETARDAGVSEFFLIQWVAPFLAEFPESLTAFLWAGTIVLASRGLANLVSAKLNQWTLLIATIPFVYSLSVGHVAEIQLTQLSRDEILLTAAQTILGVIVLARLRFTLIDAVVLLGLFGVQFVSPYLHGPTTIAYLVVAAIYVVVSRSPLQLLRAIRGSAVSRVGGSADSD